MPRHGGGAGAGDSITGRGGDGGIVYPPCSPLVQCSLISQGKVERMTMLLSRFQQYMQEHYAQCASLSYTTQSLKAKLVAFIGDRLSFWVPQARNKSELVFSSDIDIGEAIESAFEASTSDKRIIEKAATILNGHIKGTWQNSPNTIWPPNADDLSSGKVKPPIILEDFLKQVITGRRSRNNSARVDRISASIAADICVACSNGQWMMPEHILLGMFLQHLTGSAEIVTIINRYGFCPSYSKLLEIETAIANAVQTSDDILPSNVSVTGNKVSLMCWDNFDVSEETRSGAGTTHITHGIVIQTVDKSLVEKVERTSQIRTKERSFKPILMVITPCYASSKVEPVLGDVVDSASSIQILEHD
jgi:hypothetical protein